VVEVDPSGLLGLSALQIAKLIRNGKLKSVDAVEVFIKQIESVNPVLNAMVATRFEEARKEAQQADRLMQTTPIEGLILNSNSINIISRSPAIAWCPL